MNPETAIGEVGIQQNLEQFLKAEIQGIQAKISELQSQHPQLQQLNQEILRDFVADIEADTYAELIRADRLNEQLSPILWQAFED